MKYDLNEFLTSIKITIIFIILIISMNCGVAIIDYIIYRVNSSEYELVEGRVINLNYVNLLPAKGSFDNGAIYFSKSDILYTLNGINYVETNLRVFSDKQKGDTVLLAINNNMVRRGDLYEISFVEKILIIWLTLCIIILFFNTLFKNKD